MLEKLLYIFSRQDKWKLIILFIMLVAGSFMELLGIAAFMPLVTAVMNPELIQENDILFFLYKVINTDSLEIFLTALAFGIIIIFLFKNIYLAVLQNYILRFSYRIRMTISVKLLKTYLSEPYTFHLNKNVAEIQRSMGADANQFMLFISAALQVMAEIIMCITIGIYLFNISNSITVVVAGLLVICIGIFSLISRKVTTKIGQQNQKFNAKLIQWINQSIGGIKEVKVLHREEFFISTYRENYLKLNKGERINGLLSAMPKYIIETVTVAGLLLAIVVKIFFGRSETSAFIPQLAIFAMASFKLLPSVGKINTYINNLMYALPSVDTVYRELKEIEGCHTILSARNDHDNWRFNELIEVKNLSYHYPDSDELVLNNVGLNIKYGETIALIGPSGAGKTTLADIILGLLPPTDGDVLADSRNIYDNLNLWHNQLGYIPQTIYLSDDSIRNNVAFGIAPEKINDEAIKEALKKAQLLDFVMSLENGLDTFVGDRGVRLSGGQRQRIGIARALYHDPEILVLDEATSALDNETETAVMESIEKLKGSKTMIIIAHRLTTIKNADRVYEVKDGKVMETKCEEG